MNNNYNPNNNPNFQQPNPNYRPPQNATNPPQNNMQQQYNNTQNRQNVPPQQTRQQPIPNRNVKQCKKCKAAIHKQAKVCPYCRSKQGTSALGIVFTIIGAIFIFGIAGAFLNGYNNFNDKQKAKTEAKQYSEAEYKDMCTLHTYEEIARDSSALKGQLLKIEGKVQQVGDGFLRVAITKNGSWYSDDIIIEYNKNNFSQNFLENDIITVYGKSTGFKTYTGLLGQRDYATIQAVYVDIIPQSTTQN